MNVSKRAPVEEHQSKSEPGEASECVVEYLRLLPIGAELSANGATHFRLWAPSSETVEVTFGTEAEFKIGKLRLAKLRAEGNGYHSGVVREATEGLLYKYRLTSGNFPDPASRFQPHGPHGPSEIVNPRRFEWSDQSWQGVPREKQVIYEMHIGTFTPEGTWASALRQLPGLAELGITVVELMPVAEFPGRFGWGYDGVDLFAPSHLYGTPDEFRHFVDVAHEAGIGVILDVVYNHFGPDGNYLKHFSPHYFSDRYKNEWGEALNFDSEHSASVREFFLSNVEYWVREFHLDGLRLDATQQIFDSSPNHILRAIARRVREAGGNRKTYIVGENECQHANLVRGFESGGYGLDALWNDDFHHSAIVAVTGHNEAYYTDHRGSPQEFISAAKYGYLYQGQWYTWQNRRRGTPSLGLRACNFVNFIQNHDQVANSLGGARIQKLTSPGRFRALTALLLLSPGTPMLLQGQEFGASSPFLYFADHNPELARLVAKGRKEFLEQFESLKCPETEKYLEQPEKEETFLKCKLDFSEREKHASIYNLHKDLLQLRATDSVISEACFGKIDGAVLGEESFALRYFTENGSDRLLLVNFGRDLDLSSTPEPLLAPVHEHDWKLAWSSEEPRYGGCGTATLNTEGHWKLPGHAAMLLIPEPLKQSRFTAGIAV